MIGMLGPIYGLDLFTSGCLGGLFFVLVGEQLGLPRVWSIED